MTTINGIRKRVLYNNMFYELTAIDKKHEMGLYKNSNKYIVATKDTKLLMQFEVTPETVAIESARKLGFMGY